MQKQRANNVVLYNRVNQFYIEHKYGDTPYLP